MSDRIAPNRQRVHAVLPACTAEEVSRQDFVRAFKLHLAHKVAPGNRLAYERRAAPKYAAQKGRRPQHYSEVREAMASEPFYNFWSAMQRNSQEMMWSAVQISVERQGEALIERFRKTGALHGSLELDPDLPLPSYHGAVDIHCMPGGYHSEFADDDLSNGAVYDRAVWVYVMGRMGPLNDDMGQSAVNYLKSAFPDLSPRRILEFGCGVGHSTLPYVDAYPDAEMHAIDVGAPVLRYAHARAESLGKAVHFAQKNAEATDYPDGHFDLIVSHIFVHETSHKAMRSVMRETHRLLKPGGIVLHLETPPYRMMADPFDAFILDWDTYNNNEPYWQGSHEIDAREMAGKHGFDVDSTFEAMQPSAFEAAETDRTRTFQGGDFGGAGVWYLWGMRKPSAAEVA